MREYYSYDDNYTNIGFVLGKPKVAPASGHTIPRLELCAEVLAVEVAQSAIEQLKMNFVDVKFDNDSRVA